MGTAKFETRACSKNRSHGAVIVAVANDLTSNQEFEEEMGRHSSRCDNKFE